MVSLAVKNKTKTTGQLPRGISTTTMFVCVCRHKRKQKAAQLGPAPVEAGLTPVMARVQGT
jgi:hypothetical protein